MENDKNRDYDQQHRNPQQQSQKDSQSNSTGGLGSLNVKKDHTAGTRLNSEDSDPNVDTDEESRYKKENATDESTTTEDINVGNLTAEDIERDLIKKGFDKDDKAGTSSDRYHDF
jgi:hypothetical protein